jgi:Xaa-Pro aminopeptidase
MSVPTSFRFGSRLAHIRSELRERALDAAVITHLPNLRYLCGFSGSAGALGLTAADCRLVVDFRYATAARDLVEQHRELSTGLELVVADQNLDQRLIAVLQQSGASRIGIEAAAMSVARFNRLSDALTAGSSSGGTAPMLIPTDRLIEHARVVKDAEEIAIMREAGRILAAAAAQVPELVKAGRREIDIAADIDGLLRRVGFERPAFETIVASGPNSALPHARPRARVVKPSDGVVLDFGGVYDGYCVDLTRTVQVGDGGPELSRLINAVADAQEAAIATVRSGVKASLVDAAARQTLERYGLAEAFGHGTGHGLGLEVHEEPRIGRYSSGQIDASLESGMVFTIEPGAYVAGFGGARIEDDVLVTDHGCEVLTRAR